MGYVDRVGRGQLGGRSRGTGTSDALQAVFNVNEDERTGVVLEEPLLTADDVAQLLAVPRSTVYDYARRRHNGLPSISVGRHRRFYRSDVERWLEKLRG